ncbi:MAG: sigma 54-interacting transcriptional regulator [Myxococcota bacterium]
MAHSTDRIVRPRLDDRGFVLRVLDGNEAGQRWELDHGPCLIGTAQECELRLSAPTVSSRHAVVEIEANGVVITDQGSTNGTLYGNALIDRVIMPPGATFSVGGVRLIVEAPRRAGLAPTSYGSLIGVSPPARELYRTLVALEKIDQTVLLVGETGVGKGHIAHEIHRNSSRKDGPFEVFDCGAVAASLIESELFGHVRGAFTGATSRRTGVFQRAEGGTVFLDELGELPMDLQPRLLRVLSDSEVRPVGGARSAPVNVRVIAATNQNLRRMITNRSFRADLYHRLNVFQIKIPSLRERREDIPLLIQHFLQAEGLAAFPLDGGKFSEAIANYSWPGNVRELRNAVVRVAAMRQAGFDLPADFNSNDERASTLSDIEEIKEKPYQQARRIVLDAFERDYLEYHIAEAGGSLVAAARAAGMDRSYFRRVARRHGLEETK